MTKFTNTAASRKTRLTFDFPWQIDERISDLAVKKGVTKAVIVRRAFSVLEELEKLEAEGYSVGAWKSEEGKITDKVRILMSA